LFFQPSGGTVCDPIERVGLSGRVEAGWKQSFNWFSVTPFAALQVSQLWQNAFTETNPVPASATDPLA
jgi:uncharacterized protein with beta-barrel porin domain